ncbi:MAG: hypothetical protein OXU23_07005 [Candidatus Poribacteria bacterium]|nr:hypothetical protein [Candidatus Poribacteria bacterium]
MQSNDLTPFLSNYLTSLLERTRAENKGIKIGFDWVIYNLAIAKNWTPVRLPFFRAPSPETPKTKTEAELGIDLAFLSESGQELIIFVLKDEALTNRNWQNQTLGFYADLQMASTVNLKQPGLESVGKVSIVLAYNKDEDRTGIQLFEQTTQFFGEAQGDGVKLTFERWNLTRLVEEVKSNLLTPELMPQHLSSALQYICLQVGDFDFGSAEWENQLVPQWRYFLNKALEPPIDERKLRLVPVALMIIHEYRKKTPNSYPGWIDLIEWAMLALWDTCRDLKAKELKDIVANIWLNFYVEELTRYFFAVQDALTTEHGLAGRERGRDIGQLGAVRDAYIAYWHLGRLGILNYAPQQFWDIQDEDRENFKKHLKRNVEWLGEFFYNNPSALRPLLDVHHVELFLVWLMLWQVKGQNEIYEWLGSLENCLLTRRVEMNRLPFIEARNRTDLVAEFAATSKRPPEFTDGSSYLLLMILELCFSLEESQRDELLERYFEQIVKGVGVDGQPLDNNKIDLLGWIPPDDWDERILREPVTDGTAIMTHNFEFLPNDQRSLVEKIQDFVGQCREKFPPKAFIEVPRAALILACIKHQSPLPPKFWRGIIFPEEK